MSGAVFFRISFFFLSRRMDEVHPTPVTGEDLASAARTLVRSGVRLVVSASGHHFGVGEVAARLDCGKTWVRTHLTEFPNAWRMPGGEVRIPASDLEALAKRNRLKKPLSGSNGGAA